MNSNVKLYFSSTLDGYVLILTCENEILTSNTNDTDEQILQVTCHSNATSWVPDPADFIKSCSSFSTTLPGIEQIYLLSLHRLVVITNTNMYIINALIN